MLATVLKDPARQYGRESGGWLPEIREQKKTKQTKKGMNGTEQAFATEEVRGQVSRGRKRERKRRGCGAVGEKLS